jgi:multidrug efflux pump subunit AcrA (membrane-fusion protein)
LARWILIIAIAIGSLAAAGALALRYLRPHVVVSEPVVAPVVQAFYSTGTIAPDREYPIRSNTAGILTEVRVDKGDRVGKGDVLAVVTDTALIFLAEKAKAELNEKLKRADESSSPVLHEFDARMEATADLLASAQREQKRITDLIERNAASQTDLDRAFDRVRAGVA